MFHDTAPPMFDFCPETLLGFGSHDWTEWELFDTQWGEGGFTDWWKRKCQRCGQTEWERTHT